MHKEVNILGIPMDLGGNRRGVDMGPSALRLAGLENTLKDIGCKVRDLGNIDVPVAEATPNPNGLHFADAIAETCHRAYEHLRQLSPEAFPVVLGGDHSISMGSVSGVASKGRTGVIWVDAHADLNTPASSPSGNIHGMPLAHLLGNGDKRLLDIWGGEAVLKLEDIVFIGLRSVDAGERAFILENRLKVYTMSDIDQKGIARVCEESLSQLSHLEMIHLSFDADVLDPLVAPGVGTPVPGGLSYREAHLLMELLARSERITSLDLVEVNPTLDNKNATARIMVELAASLLGKSIL